MEGSSTQGHEHSESPAHEEETTKKEEEELMAKAQRLMEKITASSDNPNPTLLHALASLLEIQESLFLQDNGYSTSNAHSARASHNIGRLGNLLRENDDFFELISSKFFSESRYSTSVQAAAARLLLSCSLTWIYPHVFEEPIVENIKNWVMDETARFSGEDRNSSHEVGNY
ncbi:DDB1- and CUL4-associated factor homolog 1-like [Pistacia vera]|uniref:DDB1- and CUL4-associated factor homolog 1-like n=1 Tax=Pistacia vera TaxID=55513 RepID=UPI0012632EF1|nr:DDB1- and CUL4-associated factor homolog 1-like [Pistacia vera]